MLQIDRKSKCNVLITSGAGFIGANLAAYLLANTDLCVTLFDDLLEPGAAINLAWLYGQAGPGRLSLVHGNLGNASLLMAAASRADEIFHLAQNEGQDSCSIEHATALGTMNVLEAASRSGKNPTLVCTSIGNEVCAERGVAGSKGGGPLFRCSRKDRNVLAFAQLHGLRAVVLRLDTVTGPRQFAESRDWVARLEYAMLGEQPCVVSYGRRGHDVLHVTDAVQAILAARAYIGKTAGRAYTVNGGNAHWIKVEQMIQMMERICHRTASVVELRRSAEGTALPIVEDVTFRIDTSWRARRRLEETVRDIAGFWHANRQVILDLKRIERESVSYSRGQAA